MSVRVVIFVLMLGWITGCRHAAPVLTKQQKFQIQDLVNSEIAKGSFPGAVVLIGQDQSILFEEAYGKQVIEPDTLPMSTHTVFDLASLTKPLATAASVMVLMDQSRIDPNDTVASYLPDFASEGKDTVQIRHLLTHTSGLPAYTGARALEETHGSPCPGAVIKTICLSKPLSGPGETFRYSCLGYILLSQIVAQVSGQELDDFSRTHLFEPMGMQQTSFNPPDVWHARVAATEIVNEQVLCGTVHDPLARLMEGVSGNAGLFSTASDIAALCRMLLNGGKLNGNTLLSEQAVTRMTTPQLLGRGFGFDIDSSYAWIKGDHASDQSFCHSGYTGTSVVCDPQTGRFVIILTNRAHPHDKGTVKPVRKGIADIVYRDLAL